MFKKLFGSFAASKRDSVATAATFDERRKLARRSCEIEVEARLGREEFAVNVIDLSAGGLRLHLESPKKFKPKGVVKLTYAEPIGRHDLLTVEGITRWIKERASDGAQFVGVEFKDPKSLGRSWVKAKMQEIGFRPHNIKEQRKLQRVSCSLPAVLNVGGQEVSAVVKNLGLGGGLLELTKPLRAGSEVSFRITEEAELKATTLSGLIRHQQHPDPSAPFGHGLSFPSLSQEQQSALERYIHRRRQEQWDQLAKSTGYLSYLDGEETDDAQHLDDVEIPDLDSIMEETSDTDQP